MLSAILARKRSENRRRRRFAATYQPLSDDDADGHEPTVENPRVAEDRRAALESAVNNLRRSNGPVVIGEIKFRSPSAGAIRGRRPGLDVEIATSYAKGGARAISVLADGPGFGGSPLMVRRVARSSPLPVLFKEFVLEELQLDLAAAVGARYVLLIVRALTDAQLGDLVKAAEARGLAPVVEAADEAEVERALASGASIVGVNARDLRTFRVDPDAAERAIKLVPSSKVAVYMSGVRDAASFDRAASGRADALLIGEGLMRDNDPETTLRGWLG